MELTPVTSLAWTNLKRLNTQLQALIENTVDESIVSSSAEPWEATYAMVFSASVSKPIYQALKELNQQFDYYDTDTSYEEDSVTFATAVNDKVEEIQTLLNKTDAYRP